MAASMTGRAEENYFTGRLFVVPTTEELARAAAGRLWGIVRERAAVLSRGGRHSRAIHVALSGGETPRRAYELMSSEPYRTRFPWECVHFYQVDERWVPAGDPLSNRRMLTEALVGRAPVPEGHFHPVDTSLPGPDEGARNYEELLRSIFADPPAGFPKFDAVLLGIGKDGHTASLFPGAPSLSAGGCWVAPASGGDPPVPRVTLTIPVLTAASQVIFVVSGREKAHALYSVLTGDASLPATRVSRASGEVTFLADGQAASATVRKGGGGGR